jgi:hypothetical protein
MRRRVVMAIGGALLVASGLGIGSVLFSDEVPPRQRPERSADNGDVGVACQVDGPDVITVPNVVGKPLGDAITRARARGLLVVDSGVRPGDPSDPSARVLSQKPQADVRVPAGACIGFRTGT